MITRLARLHIKVVKESQTIIYFELFFLQRMRFLQSVVKLVLAPTLESKEQFGSGSVQPIGYFAVTVGHGIAASTHPLRHNEDQLIKTLKA